MEKKEVPGDEQKILQDGQEQGNVPLEEAYLPSRLRCFSQQVQMQKRKEDLQVEEEEEEVCLQVRTKRRD